MRRCLPLSLAVAFAPVSCLVTLVAGVGEPLLTVDHYVRHKSRRAGQSEQDGLPSATFPTVPPNSEPPPSAGPAAHLPAHIPETAARRG